MLEQFKEEAKLCWKAGNYEAALSLYCHLREIAPGENARWLDYHTGRLATKSSTATFSSDFSPIDSCLRAMGQTKRAKLYFDQCTTIEDERAQNQEQELLSLCARCK